MNSFYNYTNNNNCNQILKKSIFFSLYNNNIDKRIYFKTNNKIIGFYKDTIINDIIYLSTNGLKKNAIFRKNETKLFKNQFVSYFRNLEDNLQIFNLYPQKYNKSLINNYLEEQNVLFNFQKKQRRSSLDKSFFIKNYKIWLSDLKKPIHLDTTANFFVKNFFDKYYFINNNGFINYVNTKTVQKNIFGGLSFILPKNIQITFKKINLLNYYLLNFFSNIEFNKFNKTFLKNNIIIYTLYLKFLNFKIYNYLINNKIKIRKSNWLLYKYIKLYSTQLNKIINFYYTTNLLKLNSFNMEQLITKWLYESNIKMNKFNIILNHLDNLNKDSKIKLINNLFFYIESNYYKVFNKINLNLSIFNQYLYYKLNLLNTILIAENCFNYLFSNNINNSLNSLNLKFIYNKPNSYWKYNGIIHNLIILSNNNELYFKRNFLSYAMPKIFYSFNKNKNLNKLINYFKILTKNELKQIKKNLNKFKRTFIRKKKNKKIIKRVNKSFTLSSKKFKFAKLKKIKLPWLKLYNNTNINK